ncbi:B12-binding domain-containing radical SAM protein [Streptomyces ipomoeae]|uniref:B12-binding domain-containing radical SAM protein n=1 Tax=Streptomyces ipomoeae TaxID=103232 RepID=UPI0018F88AC0|nr:radical SAM protein [Streptomyces ipomoeae]
MRHPTTNERYALHTAARETVVHDVFHRPPHRDDTAAEELTALRRSRRDGLIERAGCERLDQVPWSTRAFPVLAALAPVMTSPEGEITYPGDPMCLYAALSVVVDSALKSARLTAEDADDLPFTDLCPDWRCPPSKNGADRAARTAPDRYLGGHPDGTVFDPRVWDEQARDELRAFTRRLRPKVFLVSTVSPGHRYALEMARLVKEELPDCLVVFGGRHMDETMRYAPADRSVVLQYSSTLRAIEDGRAEPVVDFCVSGEGYFALDLLMKAIALAMDLDRTRAHVHDVVETLSLLGAAGLRLPGNSLLCARDGAAVHAFPIKGAKYDLAELPSPYQGFAIRSRFPVFPLPDGGPARTAHMTVTNACPYHCDFCSESALVVGGLKRFGAAPAEAALERVCEYVSYGAEAVFFDDSIFWSGTFRAIREFCEALRAARAAASPEDLPERCRRWITGDDDWRRLRALSFGCQVTADLLTTLHGEDEVREMLAALREAGCTYLYMGIESMSSEVMDHVHKNIRRVADLPWKKKVRTALIRIRESGIPVGSSVLFGLEGETRETIEETIEEVGQLVDDGLVMLASPNILTYHPATRITRDHGMQDRLDYHSPDVDNRPPYIYFEEAFPGVVSRRLSEDDIWFIHESTAKRWGAIRNSAEPEFS